METKRRTSFGHRLRQARARPSSTIIRGLLSNSRYVEAVLKPPKNIKVTYVNKEGAITRKG